MPRVTFSPTTAPIEPPINPNSIAQHTTGRPLSWPSAVMIASFIPSFFRASFRRVAYGLVSTNFNGSVDVIPASCSVQRPSSSISSRCFEFILKWNWHLGQTKRLASRSLRKTIVRQESHFTHKPSVRTRRSSGGVVWSIDFLSRLNQVIEEVEKKSQPQAEAEPVGAQHAAPLPPRPSHPIANSRCPSEPVYPWCTGVSPRASPSPDPPVR